MSDHQTTDTRPTPDPSAAAASPPPNGPHGGTTAHQASGPDLQEGDEAAPPGVRFMAVLRWLLVFGMGLLAVASVLYALGLEDERGGPAELTGPEASDTTVRYQCPMHPAVIQDRPGECPICNMRLEPVSVAPKTAAPAPRLRYRCPMHASVVQDAPGDCPICNMKLVAVAVDGPASAEGGVPGLTAVELSPERVQRSGLRVASVVRERLAAELRTVGFVAADETSLALVTTRFAGWVEELPVATTGERVKAGQVLAALYSPELLAAQAELLNAERWRATAPAQGSGHVATLSGGLATDARRRLELLGISPAELDQVIASGEPIHALRLRAPMGGYVTRKNAVRGAYVEAGATLFEIADLGHVWVLADVYEYDLAQVKVGQTATLRLVPYPERTFTGRVEFVYPTVDPDTRTMRVRLHFANGDLALRPGMYGDVTIERPPMDAVIVPQEALIDTGKYQYVFLALEDGRFVPRRVTTGRHAEGHVEVLKGLTEGDRVVTTANFLVDSESRLRATLEGFAADSAAGGR